MCNISKFVVGLKSSDDKYAYRCLKKLEDESCHSAAVYPFFETFVKMLDDPNSYIRTRGIILIAANAKWDVEYRIDEIIDKYLQHILDAKPITARQCIKALPLVARYKPELRGRIVNALYKAKPQEYKESMQTLIIRDIQRSLQLIGLGNTSSAL